MVKEVVVTKHLSDAMIEAGRDLITSLDKDRVAVEGALWLYDSETEAWKLVIALPEIQAKGSKKAYEQVQATISKMPKNEPSISLRDISIRDTSDPFMKLMCRLLRTEPFVTGPIISGIRASGNIINGVLVEDAYIYRLT